MNKVWSKYSYTDFRFARFKLGEHEFCIDLKNVREMARHRGVEPPDGAPEFVEGFVRLRGIAVPVVDLRRRFGMEPASGEAVRIIIVSLGGRIVGFVVDEVIGVARGCKEIKVKKRPAAGEPWEGCVEAVVETDGCSVYVLNAHDLLTRSELEALDAPIGPM